MCLAQGIDAVETRTRRLSVLSQALYHWATVLQHHTQKSQEVSLFPACKEMTWQHNKDKHETNKKGSTRPTASFKIWTSKVQDFGNFNLSPMHCTSISVDCFYPNKPFRPWLDTWFCCLSSRFTQQPFFVQCHCFITHPVITQIWI